MDFSDYYSIDIDMHGFSEMAPPQFGFGSELTAIPFPTTETPAAAASSPEVEAAAVGCADERRLRRRISNRESARRSRARKQRRLDELRASAADLERRRRELAARAQAARGHLALVRLANAGLRAETAALSRRLAAASHALALGRLYQYHTAAASGGGCSLRFVDIEQTIASLIA
ncbi:unnamed protein product [Urochloa humidicola]